MKRIFLLFVVLMSGFAAVMAQEENPVKREKMMRDVQEFKMKYLAQEMDLSEIQKKKFFELYQEMNESKKECFAEAQILDRKLKEDKNASDEDYLNVRNAYNQANANWAETEKLYDEKFAEFLTPKQLYKMEEAEMSFRSKFEEMKVNRKKMHHKKHDGKQ